MSQNPNTAIARAKDLMERGWQAREDHNFPMAYTLLIQALVIFAQEGDYFNMTECWNHLAYAYKIQAGILTRQGVDAAYEALRLAQEHGVKKALILRALFSTLSAQGNFEQALKYAAQMLELMEKPAPRADILSHIAYFQLRTGQLIQAKHTIAEAVELLEQGWEDECSPHRFIWKVKILLTQSLISYNEGSIEVGRRFAEQALEIAKEQQLKTRITESESVLALFD